MQNICWQSVRDKIESQPWARATYESIQSGFKHWCDLWPHDPPLKLTGWIHHYFCARDGVKLQFDIDRPEHHVCPACNEVYTGIDQNTSWQSWVHGGIQHNLERAAILACLHPERPGYGEYIRRQLLFYARHYLEYEIHGRGVGRGRILSQHLDESIMVIMLGCYLRFDQDHRWLSDRDRDFINQHYFRPSLELLKPQVDRLHNIHCWINAGVATAALQLGDDENFHWAIDGEFGWKNQIQHGVSEDGFWYEGAMTYHYYSFFALFYLAWIAEEKGIQLWSHPKLQQMLCAPMDLVYPDGRFPAYNDGWAHIKLHDYAGAYEFACKKWPDAGFEKTLSLIYSSQYKDSCVALSRYPDPNPAPRTEFSRNSAWALLFGPPELPNPPITKRHHVLLKSSGMGILSNQDVRLTLRFTPHGGGHDHNDKLSVDLWLGNEKQSMRGVDLGTSGYGVAITNVWHRRSAAHNLVVVNGAPQKPSSGKLLEWDDPVSLVRAEADDAYPGAKLRRELRLDQTGLSWSDHFHVRCEEESILDWIFHCEGLVAELDDRSKARLENAKTEDLLGSFKEGPNGYDQIRDLQKFTTTDSWGFSWVHQGMSLKLGFEKADATEVFLGRAPSNPATDSVGIVVVRRRSKETVFRAGFVFSGVPANISTVTR
jgi:hypothetical protein